MGDGVEEVEDGAIQQADDCREEEDEDGPLGDVLWIGHFLV